MEKPNIFRILPYNINDKIMKKYIRALEVPFYLLIIAYACVERGNTGIAILLGIVSVLRLLTNVLTDEFIYKR